MKVIFLDIDGVLNSLSSLIALGGYPHPGRDYHLFQWISVRLLQKLVDDTGAIVVLSSTWRDYVGLKELGDAIGVHLFSKTRSTVGNEIRGVQIQEWLDEHPDVEKYIIIDDNSDMHEHQKEFFVKTDYEVGFMYPEYQKAITLLGIEKRDN